MAHRQARDSERRRHPFFIVFAIILAMAVALPVGASELSDARKAREEARRERAQKAQQLDVLHAEDAELEAALADIRAHLNTQKAALDAAQQAVNAAEAEVSTTQAAIEATLGEIERLRRLAADHAVLAYMQSEEAPLTMGDEFNTAEKRAVLLDAITGRQADTVDRLRAAEEDLADLKVDLEAALEKAASRRDEVAARTAEVQAAYDAEAKAKAQLEARIAEFRSEVDALAKEEAALTALIRRKEEEARRAAAAAAAASGATPGGVSARGLIWPVRGRVTSEYGQRWGRLHAGIDIGAPSGTPIWAAADGVVIYSGTRGAYGQVVIIDHGGGFTTVYAHQSKRAAADGQRVARGAVIGYVGNTGRSTGPHLHFETRVNGSPRNPRQYLP